LRGSWNEARGGEEGWEAVAAKKVVEGEEVPEAMALVSAAIVVCAFRGKGG
jgi:hypothetical protein